MKMKLLIKNYWACLIMKKLFVGSIVIGCCSWRAHTARGRVQKQDHDLSSEAHGNCIERDGESMKANKFEFEIMNANRRLHFTTRVHASTKRLRKFYERQRMWRKWKICCWERANCLSHAALLREGCLRLWVRSETWKRRLSVANLAGKENKEKKIKKIHNKASIESIM